MWIDRAEKLGRMVLWLSMASVFVLVPVGLARQHDASESRLAALHASQEKAEAQAREAAATAAAKLPARMQLSGFGAVLTMLTTSKAEGLVAFTNVSRRSGVVCVEGTATHRDTKRTASSLASCKEVGPYSSVTIELTFAGTQLKDVCGDDACKLTVEDVPDDE